MGPDAGRGETDSRAAACDELVVGMGISEFANEGMLGGEEWEFGFDMLHLV